MSKKINRTSRKKNKNKDIRSTLYKNRAARGNKEKGIICRVLI